MADKSDKIGYGRPPVHSRFKPGQSGNPRGRPKGSLNFETDLKRTLQAPVTLNEWGQATPGYYPGSDVTPLEGKSAEGRG